MPYSPLAAAAVALGRFPAICSGHCFNATSIWPIVMVRWSPALTKTRKIETPQFPLFFLFSHFSFLGFFLFTFWVLFAVS